jgi:hypothetical protein
MFSMWLFHLAWLDKVTPTCKYLWLIVIGILFPLNEKLKLYLLFVNYCEETSHLHVIFLNYHCRIVQLISLKCTGDCLDLAKPRLFWKTRGTCKYLENDKLIYNKIKDTDSGQPLVFQNKRGLAKSRQSPVHFKDISWTILQWRTPSDGNSSPGPLGHVS